MKKVIRILGSAAAEGIPAIFCRCRVCQNAWKNGGKDMRFRTAYSLGSHVRIDFGPDTIAQEYRFGLHSEDLKHLFFSHSHEDHVCAHLLRYRRKGMSGVPEGEILNVYGGKGTIRLLNRECWNETGDDPCSRDWGYFRMNPVRTFYFQKVEIPEEDMTFYPMKADHQRDDIEGEMPQFYIIRWGESLVMIANDTGILPEEDYEFIQAQGFHFDVVISDCTGGILDRDHGHMSGKYVLQVKDRLTAMGAVTEKTRYFINHFSHNGQATHKELEEHFGPYGIQVGYDGLEIPL